MRTLAAGGSLMKRVGIAMLLTTVIGMTLIAADQDADRMLKAAMNAELVDGNVKGAIDQYKRIVDRYAKSDRATAARALLRMAEAYQKLGDAEAERIYQRVVREFGDQSEPASIARTRLRRNQGTPGHGGD